MLAVGFQVEFQDGAEVYQLHASPEQWPKLLKSKEQVEAAVTRSKQQQQQQQQQAPPTGNPNPFGAAGTGFPGMPGNGPPLDPNMQNLMSRMLSDPQALRATLQVRIMCSSR
jgi:hypothetical protein